MKPTLSLEALWKKEIRSDAPPPPEYLLDRFVAVVNALQTSKSVLDTAKEITYGDRERTYGDPGKNLRVIGDLWRTYLSARFGCAPDLTAEDVCHMMTLLKIARLTNTPGHRDSLIDVCGYTALVERLYDHKQEAQGDRSAPERPGPCVIGHPQG